MQPDKAEGRAAIDKAFFRVLRRFAKDFFSFWYFTVLYTVILIRENSTSVFQVYKSRA